MDDASSNSRLTALPLEQLLACPECDLLMRKVAVQAGTCLKCPRCNYELYRYRRHVISRSLALVLCALLLYVPANFLPIMQLNLLGQTSHDTVWSGVIGLYESGMAGIAVVVFLCSMAVPLIKLLCQLLVLLSIQFKVGRSIGLGLYRCYHLCKEWGMLEVYLFGILVSMVKLKDLADLSVGIGLVCFIALLLVQIWLEVTMSEQQIWAALTGKDQYAGQ